MSEYNASDTKQIRKARAQAKIAETERQGVIFNLMSSPAGRNYVHDTLTRCHIFASSFNPSQLGMAFNEGERNIGLQLLNDVMAFAPDQYVQMMREANDRRIADDNSQSRGRGANGRGDDSRPIPDESAGTVASDYDPGDDLSGEAG